MTDEQAAALIEINRRTAEALENIAKSLQNTSDIEILSEEESVLREGVPGSIVYRRYI